MTCPTCHEPRRWIDCHHCGGCYEAAPERVVAHYTRFAVGAGYSVPLYKCPKCGATSRREDA